MRVVLSLCFFCFTSLLTHAQDLILTPIGETLCRPGVTNKSPGKGISYSYGFNPSMRWNPGNGTSASESSAPATNKRIGIKLKAPILNKEKIKLLVGWNYYSEEYEFDLNDNQSSIFSDINDQHLKSSRLSLYMIRPINHKFYFALKAVASFNGDYSGLIDFDPRYTRYDVAMIFGIKKKENKEWGIGLLARKNFNNSFPLIPFAMYNHTFNSKWGLEATIPTNVQIRYNANDKNIILFGPQFDSRTYSIDLQDDPIGKEARYTMQRSELRLMLRYQHNVKSWLWGEISTGYVRNFTTRFELIENGPETRRVDFLPSNGPVFNISLFLSPPKSMYK